MLPKIIATSLSSKRFIREWPYLLLTSFFGLTFAAMAVVGLNLGFNSDILAFEYHLSRMGLRDGINWIFRSDGRHLLSGIVEAELHVLFPWQSAAAYATSILFYFGIALLLFLLADTLSRGECRWVSFSASLLYAFGIRQAHMHFDLPNTGFHKLALIFELLSILCYLSYVRRGRQAHLLRELSILFYALSIFLFEATILFFLLNPLIAWIEDRQNHTLGNRKDWLIQMIRDNLAYPVVLLGYLVILFVTVPTSGAPPVSLSPGRIFQQVMGGLLVEFSPAHFLTVAGNALQGNWWLLTFSVMVIVFLILWFWSWRAKPTTGDTPYFILMAVGGTIIFLNLFGVAPGNRPLDIWDDYPYVTYSAFMGIVLFLCSVGALLLNRIPNVFIRRICFGVVVAFWVGVGFTQWFQIQKALVAAEAGDRKVQAAILQAVPSIKGDVTPYFLLITDHDPDQFNLPGSRGALLLPSPLSTARDTFASCRASLSNALCRTRLHNR